MLRSIVVTGEGPTDMGSCTNPQEICSCSDFEIGGVVKLLFKLICHHLPAWNADNLNQENPAEHMTFIYRGWFKEQPKSPLSKSLLPSKRLPSDYLVYANRAAVLADFAKQHDHQMAVYLHDTDNLDWKTLCNLSSG